MNATKKTKSAIERAGLIDFSMKLEGEELQRHIQRKAATFQDRRTKRNRDRSANKRNHIKDSSY